MSVRRLEMVPCETHPSAIAGFFSALPLEAVPKHVFELGSLFLSLAHAFLGILNAGDFLLHQLIDEKFRRAIPSRISKIHVFATLKARQMRNRTHRRSLDGVCQLVAQDRAIVSWLFAGIPRRNKNIGAMCNRPRGKRARKPCCGRVVVNARFHFERTANGMFDCLLTECGEPEFRGTDSVKDGTQAPHAVQLVLD